MSPNYLRIILDIVFPPTEHAKLLRTVTPPVFLTHYLPTNHADTVTLCDYTSRTVKAAVAACKFERNTHAARLLATLPEKWLEAHPANGVTVLVPIPLSRTRERERGFNQVTRVLSYLPRNESYRIETHVLTRPTDTIRQTSLGRSARLENMQCAFAMSDAHTSIDWTHVARVIICDDVFTTGATLTAAKQALRPHVPKHIPLLCMAWAH